MRTRVLGGREGQGCHPMGLLGKKLALQGTGQQAPSKQDIKIIGGDVYPNWALIQDVKITAVVNFDQDIKIWATKMAQQAKALMQAWKSVFNPWNPHEDTRRETTP